MRTKKAMATQSPVSGPAFYIETFGCKLNQFESAEISEILTGYNLRRAVIPAESEMIIVNTCTVTDASDRKVQHRLAELRRENGRAFIVLTGCMAQTQRENPALTPANLVLGNYNKTDIPCILRHFRQFQKRNDSSSFRYHHREIPTHPGMESITAPGFGKVGRAMVKIQDGCDYRCSFCIVWKARGPGRSVPAEKIKDMLRFYADAGFTEAVLTGVHIGLYGRDRGSSLLDLLKDIGRSRIPLRIRLSSIDPHELHESFIDFITDQEFIQPHFHIPVQHGSDRILRRMFRAHRVSHFLHAAERIKRKRSETAIGIDMISGFPGERVRDFRASLHLIRHSPVDYAHIFPFSPRHGTVAMNAPDQVPIEARKRRARILRRRAQRKWRQFVDQQGGRTRKAIVLYYDTKGQHWVALTDNYIKCVLEDSRGLIKTRRAMIDIMLFRSESGIYGRPLDSDTGGQGPIHCGKRR